MKLLFYPYTLKLKQTFTLAGSSRSSTPIVLTEIHHEGHVGYGEASLPPYLKETQESVIDFLKKIDFSKYSSSFDLQELVSYISTVSPGNYAAKASIEIALHDLAGKLAGKPCYEIWGLDPQLSPPTSFTIGIDTPEIVSKKAKEAAEFSLIKVKLGKDTDKQLIQAIRSVTDKPICADVNQGWTDKQKALDMLHWCKEQNVLFVEQPMPVSQTDDMAWLTQHSPIPTFADESFQNSIDFDNVKGVFSGINIKLMKCGGLSEARKCISEARKSNLKVMIGCMTETSCAISAAAQLAPLADFVDLDGNLLIANDCFSGAKLKNGKVIPTDLPGIGVQKSDNNLSD